MATGMLRGLKQRVEAHPQPSVSGRTSWSGASPSTGARHSDAGTPVPHKVRRRAVARPADTT
jgi:hypothetical protein